MKNTYLIIHELNNKTKDYSIFYNTIKLINNNKWLRCFDSVWVIKDCLLTADEISNKLLPYIDIDVDLLLVIEVNRKNEQGWLPKKSWRWLEDEDKEEEPLG